MAWILPCAGTISSPYGPRILAAGMFPFHYGVDVRAGRGPIFAAQDGIVRTIWITSVGGWVVDIRHPDEGGQQVRTRYIHMNFDEIRVVRGQKVKAGDWIGNSGTSGSPNSPHLHFEVLVNGVLIDPVPFLATRGLTFGVSLVSRVIDGVGVPPTVPDLTLPDPLEDDMPLNDADKAWILDAIQTRAHTAVLNILRAPEFELQLVKRNEQVANVVAPQVLKVLRSPEFDLQLYKRTAHLRAVLAASLPGASPVDVAGLAAELAASLVPAVTDAVAAESDLTFEQAQAAAEAAVRNVLGSLG